MGDDRESDVWASVELEARRAGEPVGLCHVCRACMSAVQALGVSVSMRLDGESGEPVYATGPVSDELAELEFTLGEGPCVDALRGPTPVLVADLADERFVRRWPMFSAAAIERGVTAVFALPLRAGLIHAGVMEVYRSRPGMLTGDELANALSYADAALLLALGTVDGAAVNLSDLGVAEFDERRAEVHQAAGMISVQLGIGIDEAFVRLRAFAYAREQRLIEVARAVVERTLRFTRDDGGPPYGDISGAEKGGV